MARREPPPHTYAAFCEEFDEDANDVVPDTRKVANVAARRSRPELKPASRSADGASDSGYSSRTAATIASGDSSLTSGTNRTSLDTPITNRTMDRVQDLLQEEERARPRVKAKERRDNPEGKAMQSAARRASSRPAPPRSASKSRKRESTSSRNGCACWDCERERMERAGYQQPMMPPPGVDPRTMDRMHYGHPPPHGYEVPPSPHAPRYPPIVNQENYPGPATRPQRSNSYHTQNRPMSYHAGSVPDVGMSYMHMAHPAYNQGHGHGPPLSASAYSNSFYPSAYMGSEPQMSQPSRPPYDPSYDAPQLIYERPSRSSKRSTSTSRSPDKPPARRPSVRYTSNRPVVQYAKASRAYHGEPERLTSRERRARRQSQAAYDPDEDYYRMPPPPPPQPQKPKSPAQVIPIPNPKRPMVRKSNTTANTPVVDCGAPFEMEEIRQALPRLGRRESREPVSPERRPSMPPPKNRVRTTTYHDPSRAAQVISESRRRRSSVYSLEQTTRDLEEKQREVEEYQAARTPRLAPLTADSLRKVRRFESDSDSQHSRTESSRGSDSHTKYGSNVGSTRVEDDSITMIIRGVKIDLSSESDRRINVRSGHEGGIELNIEGRRPKRYILPRSDSTTVSGRREMIEDVRRVRDDARSDRDSSRRSSRSGYSGRGLLD